MGAREDLIETIIRFVASAGIKTRAEPIAEPTLLPGMAIRKGVLVYDPAADFAPGDLLHEAGHIAVADPAARANDPFESHGGDEMSALAWSWAAAVHLGVPAEQLFHADGYKGEGAWLAETFKGGNFIGLPLLQLYGMTIVPARAEPGGPPPFPHMLRWVR